MNTEPKLRQAKELSDNIENMTLSFEQILSNFFELTNGYLVETTYSRFAPPRDYAGSLSSASGVPERKLKKVASGKSKLNALIQKKVIYVVKMRIKHFMATLETKLAA